jgi:signal transduction histidine kinase
MAMQYQEPAMKKKRWRWNERTRLVLTLELAVVLPAAALILFSVLHLESVKRDRGVEAAIQRDFYQVLAISEKQMSEKIYDMAEAVRHDMPQPGDACTSALDHVLDRYPYAAHVLIYSPDKGVVFRSRQSRVNDSDFRTEADDMSRMMGGWIRMDYESFVKEFRQMEAKGKPPIMFDNNAPMRGDKHLYQNIAVFPIPGGTDSSPAIGSVVFDAEYLRDVFLPETMNALMSRNAEMQNEKTGSGVMMAHMKGESTPLAVCSGWDGGQPEVERALEKPFQGLVLAIKLRGTTLAALGQRFVRTSFMILGGLSLLLAGGIFLTYRNVSKEMDLAKLKSDFVSNVSHELRTPLSLIRLYAETLEMGRLPNQEKREEYYCIIRKESERLTALINNILDFSRIEAGRKEYDFRQTDLAELVRNTLDSYRYQIEQNGFSFQQHIASDLPPVRVDREAMARSLLNLVNNALKYSHNEKFLGVNLYRENGSLKLEVVDHGIGIPHPEQHKIFEKFYRVGDPLVHNTKGSGLGLALVRHIVEAHGGEVRVESDPGQGSKFIITLPVNANAVTRELKAVSA